jgi:hypothetical protein
MTEASKADTNAGRMKATQVSTGARAAPTTLEPLIQELRRAGIASGAAGPDDGEGRAWIQFPAASSLRDFLNVVARFSNNPAAIYSRLPWPGEPEIPEPRWEVQTWVEDRARYKESSDPDWPEVDRPPEFRLTHTLHIPHEDLPEVMGRLRGHNRAAR